MKLHRFYIDRPLTIGSLTIVDIALVHQIRSVLKIARGERLILFNKEGVEGEAVLIEVSKNTIAVEVQSIGSNAHEPKIDLTLYAALTKGEHFEMIAEKCTEIGVNKIVPLITERTIKLGLRRDRLEKIIKEATEQSGRSKIPILSDPLSLDEALKKRDKNASHFFLDPMGFSLPKESKIGGSRTLWVGPEGGWTAHELDLARKEKLEIYSLGSTILRAETAAIVGSFTILYL